MATATEKEDRPPKSQQKKRDYRAENAKRRDRNRGRTSGRTRTPASARGKESLEPGFLLYLDMMGRVLDATVDKPRGEPSPTCGETIIAQAPKIAHELHLLTQKNPALYKFASEMLSAGGAGGLAMAFWPVVIKLAQNHVLPGVARRRAALEEMIDEEAFDAEEDAADSLLGVEPEDVEPAMPLGLAEDEDADADVRPPPVRTARVRPPARRSRR